MLHKISVEHFHAKNIKFVLENFDDATKSQFVLVAHHLDKLASRFLFWIACDHRTSHLSGLRLVAESLRRKFGLHDFLRRSKLFFVRWLLHFLSDRLNFLSELFLSVVVRVVDIVTSLWSALVLIHGLVRSLTSVGVWSRTFVVASVA